MIFGSTQGEGGLEDFLEDDGAAEFAAVAQDGGEVVELAGRGGGRGGGSGWGELVGAGRGAGGTGFHGREHEANLVAQRFFDRGRSESGSGGERRRSGRQGRRSWRGRSRWRGNLLGADFSGLLAQGFHQFIPGRLGFLRAAAGGEFFPGEGILIGCGVLLFGFFIPIGQPLDEPAAQDDQKKNQVA
jgi:hypothetical protein